jgi:hypothetical protein
MLDQLMPILSLNYSIVFERLLRLVLAVPTMFILIIIVIVNVRLAYQPEVIIGKSDTIQYELLKELRGLKSALKGNADLEMQNTYPEGYVFLNAIYALAWSSFLSHDDHNRYFNEGHAEIRKAWLKINSHEGRSQFSEDLLLPYGSFYNGWSSYVLASKLRLENEGMRNAHEVQHFKQQCKRIAQTLQHETYPLSYHEGAWPADVMLCVASLSMHDQLFDPEYNGVIEMWLNEVKKRLDGDGMIPHSVHSDNGKPKENARGSSMALTLIFLSDIDYPFAQDQSRLFNENFVDTLVGLTAVREYPKGHAGTGDIDSGPVILGFGGAATIVGMQTLSLFGEHEASLKIRNAVEAMAFPLESDQSKEYFLGTLPMADAFIAWSHSQMNTPAQEISFFAFRSYSMFVFALLAVLCWAVYLKAKRRVKARNVQ